jgi:hypothetical protein
MHALERLSQHTACKMLQFLAEELDSITNVGLGPMFSYCQAARIVHKTKLPEQIGGSQMHWRVSATATYLEKLAVTKAVDELWRIEGERKLRGDRMLRDCLFGTLQTGMSTESNHLRISHSRACHNNSNSSVLVKTHIEVLDLTIVAQPSHNGAHTMVHNNITNHV